MIVGIDLGTTNSLVGAFIDGSPVLFQNSSGSYLTPSAVSIQENSVIVGDAARDRLITHPQASTTSFKRLMGTKRDTWLNNKPYRPEELSSFILRSLIDDVFAATGERPTEAVISVPAHFSDAQRSATRVAGELAGLKVDRIINEPTAAALAYGLQQKDREGRFLVFDLGGGTFDVSLVETFDGILEIHATAGDNFLGGNDFLQALIDKAIQDCELTVEDIPATDLLQLRRKMEGLKIRLSQTGTETLQFAVKDRTYAWTISEDGFHQLTEPLLARLRQPLERVMHDARKGPNQIDEIILVGGATRMPIIARTVTRLLGRLPLRHIEPDKTVALGAVVAAAMKAKDVALQEHVLTDICPYTLGTAVSMPDSKGTMHHGFFMPVISRGTAIPASRETQISPISKEQTLLQVEIYQGESPTAAKNIKLGSMDIPLAMDAPFEERVISLRFTYDINGVLQVEVTNVATGEKHEIFIERSVGTLTPDEIKSRFAELQKLKIHPRDQQDNIATIARAERMYEERISYRDSISFHLLNLRSAIEGQEPSEIARARNTLQRILKEIEDK